MKKLRNVLICLLALVGVLCIYVGCGSNAPAVSGIEDGQTYILEDGDIAAVFETGSATLAKDGGTASDYASGTLIVDAGEYVLIWRDGDRTETYNFTVKHDDSVAPVVSGVTDGQQVEYGTALTPTFDKGTATLSKDGAAASAFTSGTQVTEIGKYVLTVTNEGVSVTVSFEIVIPAYAGQMTDEFLSATPTGYTNTEDVILSIEDGALRVKDVDDNNGYCLLRKQFTGLDLETYPYVEFEVLEMDYVAVKFSVGVQNIIDQGANAATYAYSPGKAYLDLKSFAEANELDTSACDLWLQISLEGKEDMSGSLSALIAGYRSVEEIPAEVPAGEYNDTTKETLSQWVANTAGLQYFDGVGAVGSILTSDSYGKFVKRVQFNTELYPYLIVDVESVVSGWKIEAFNYENNLYVGNLFTVQTETSATGKTEINLQNIFGEDECVDVLLEFYIVGKDDSGDKQFVLNGLYTSANPLYAPVISGIADGDIYNIAVHGALAPTFDKGTATLVKDGGEPVAFESGDAISAAGTYTLTALAGESMETEITFTVIDDDAYAEGTFEDFLTESKFTSTDGMFEVVNNGGVYSPTFTKAESGTMGKLSTRVDLDFTDKGVLVFEIMAGSDNFNVSAFGFELLDDVDWYRVLGKGNPEVDGYADHVEEIKDTDGATVIGYKLYFRITAAEKTDGSGTTVSWVGRKKDNLQLTVSLETDGEMAVILKSVSLVESYPGEEQGDTDEPETVIGTLLDSYNEYTGFTVTGSGGSAEYDDANDEIVLTTGDKDNVSLNKTYTFNFAENGKYLVLVFETNGYTPDAGFSLTLRNENVGPWQSLQIRFPDFARVESESLSSGRMRYTCYIEVNELTDMEAPNESHDYTAETAATLVAAITIEYGAGKTVYLQTLSQTDTVPAESGAEA